ncbi:M18 family aminopeptidase [Haematomicrobium sanguinis]|uniref:M18 family aminopeptidase n=1 Tax=Haematomicrobium sanguinis TaxID=479106 RepID=UPI0004792F89|nr:M18 family aminopeptidase [Haematomicrobium sanguinis]
MTSTSAPSTDAREHALDLGEFVAASPSSFHAVATATDRLSAAGYSPLDESDDWSLEPDGKYFVQRDGALIAFALPGDVSAATGFRILGAHTDSPSFKLKPHPDFSTAGWKQANVEIYGGPLLNSWLDRELRFAGRISDRAGREYLVSTGPIARIPQLAIHLDRGVNEGLKLDKQVQVQPIVGTAAAAGDAAGTGILSVLAKQAGIAVEDIAGADVVVADTQAPRLFGDAEQFLASGRLDNLSSVHAGLMALLDTRADGAIPMLAAFDHEEIGSGSRSGAAGPFLEDVLVRINAGLGGDAVIYRRAIAESWCVSSDAGHLVHPNYQGHHDPINRPAPGRGPLLKINANQRYTTDAPGTAMWMQACADAGVSTQEFVSNNQVPCGSTIGPITATRLGIRTVDVGLGLLSMHSAREMCHIEDALALRQAIAAFF